MKIENIPSCKPIIENCVVSSQHKHHVNEALREEITPMIVNYVSTFFKVLFNSIQQLDVKYLVQQSITTNTSTYPIFI